MMDNMSKPKKKKRIGLIIILVLFLPPLLLLIVTGALILSFYYETNAPQDIRKDEVNIVNNSLASLDDFIVNEGTTEYALSFDDKVINNALFNYVYAKNQIFNNAANFQVANAPSNNYLMHQVMGPATIGFKGAWLKFMDKDTILIYAGADLLKPLNFKTGLYLYFKYQPSKNTNENDILTLDKVWLGNCYLAKGVRNFALQQVFKYAPALKEQLTKIKGAFYQLDIEAWAIKFNRQKMLSFLLSNYLLKNSNPIYQLINNRIDEGDVIDLKFVEKKVAFSMALNKLTNTETYQEETNEFANLRVIDIFRQYKEEILLNFTNFTSLKKTSITLSEDTIKKFFRYLLDTNGISNIAIFTAGYNLDFTDQKGTNYRYNLKSTVPKIEKIDNGIFDLSLEFKIIKAKDNNTFVQTKMRVKMQLKFDLVNEAGETKLKTQITTFNLGQLFNFIQNNETDQIKPLLQLIKKQFNIKQLTDDGFTFDYSFERFEKELGVTITELKYFGEKITVILNLAGIVEDSVNSIKQSILKIIGMFANGKYSEYAHYGLNLLAQNSTFIDNSLIANLKSGTLTDAQTAIINTISTLNKSDNTQTIAQIMALVDEDNIAATQAKLEEYIHDQKVKALNNLATETVIPPVIWNEFKQDLFLQTTLLASEDLKSVLQFK